MSGHFIQAVRDRYHLAIGDADGFVVILRLWIAPRFLVDSSGKLTIQVLHRASACHGFCVVRFYVVCHHAQDSRRGLDLREGVAEVKQFRQGSLGGREVSQAGGDGTFACFLRVVFAIGHHGQVSKIERSQVTFENLGSQWDQPVEDLIDVPQLILVARLVMRTDG